MNHSFRLNCAMVRKKMWLDVCSFVFFGGLISAEVITLIKDKKITCVLTENSVNSTIYVTNINGNESLERTVNEIVKDNRFNIDWNKTNLSNNFGPILDQRWTSFRKSDHKLLERKKIFSVCLMHPLNITINDGVHNNSIYLILGNYSKNDQLCRWHHYEFVKNCYNLRVLETQKELFNENMNNFTNMWIIFPENVHYKLHDYDFLYSDTSNTNESYLNVTSISCIALYVSIDEGCYLNISLLPTNEVIKVNGFNRKYQIKEWKKYEIRSKRNENLESLSFYRGNDSFKKCFWAINDIHSCSSKQVVYKMNLNQPWTNQTCMELNGNTSYSINSSGKVNHINCSEALGSLYTDCKEHRICLAENQCYCAWGYKGQNCNETCENSAWGLDCKEKCSLNCDQCDPRTGCQKCKSMYFGENCTDTLPVVNKAPTLESIENNSIKILVPLQCNNTEKSPEFYFVQGKKLYGTDKFQNYTKVKKYPSGKENISVEIRNLTRDYSYQLRVILVIQNESFQENTVPELIVHKKSLHARVKDDYRVALTWTKPENNNFYSYKISYECSTLYSNETEKKSNTTDKTSIELNIKNETTNCTFKLFGTTDARSELIDQTVLTNVTLESHFPSSYDLANKSIILITASALSVTVLIIAITGFIYYICIRRKREHENHKSIPTIKFSELGENEALIDNNNEIIISSKVIKINDFANYLLTSLDEHLDDNVITQQFQTTPRASGADSNQGRLDENFEKNRYRNVLPYDNTRVVLVGNENGDYINANYIDGYDTPKAFIATQAPLPATVRDFWHMIWQGNVNIIAMLTELEENGRVKSEKYWPEQGARFRFGNFRIECISLKITSHYVHRELQVIFNKQIRLVDHFQYISWPDHGVPLHLEEYTAFMKNIMKLEKNTPTVVHCNAGCGRTGTFILCNILIRMAIKEKQLDFFGVLNQIRAQRAGLVSNVEQYIFSHFVVMQYFFGEDFSIPVGDTFEEEVRNALNDCNIKHLSKSLKKSRPQCERTKLKTTIQLTDEDKSKNRFSWILPDLSQIFLPVSSHESSNYINAVAVDCYQCPKKFIVTQQPLPNTIVDFWKLVQEHNIDTIVSLNKITDKDSNCPRFWPDNTDTWTLGTTTLAFFSKETDNAAYNLIRIEIGSTTKDLTKNVVIIDMEKWKRKTNQPSNIRDLIYVWQKIMTCEGQIIVTCYDGATASGLFVAVAFLLEKINLDHSCDVYTAVRTVRQSRVQFVDNDEQLKCLYHVALEYIREFCT